MDPIVCGVDRLQNAGVVNVENEVTEAIDAVMDCVEVSAVVDPSTASVKHHVIAPRQHLPSVVKNANNGNSGGTHTNGSPSGQNQVFNPLVAQQSSIDLCAPGQDERVLDGSDWCPTQGCMAVLVDVGHSADQPNVSGLHIHSSMSPSTPVGVDGAINPQPAGVNAGISVNPMVRTNSMPDQHVSEFLLLLIKKMNLLAPPSELGVSFETDAAIDIRWDAKPEQVLDQSSRYKIHCSFRVGLFRDEEPISFQDRSLTLPLFQSLCVSDSAADEVVDEIQFREALIGLGVPVTADDMDLLD